VFAVGAKYSVAQRLDSPRSWIRTALDTLSTTSYNSQSDPTESTSKPKELNLQCCYIMMYIVCTDLHCKCADPLQGPVAATGQAVGLKPRERRVPDLEACDGHVVHPRYVEQHLRSHRAERLRQAQPIAEGLLIRKVNGSNFRFGAVRVCLFVLSHSNHLA